MTDQMTLRQNLSRPQVREASGYLGPGKVIQLERTGALVVLESGQQRRATLALAIPHEPSVGDTLLVMVQGDSCYAIGVLSGAPSAGLTFQGDLEVHAVGGKLTLSGDEGVDVVGKRITLRAHTLRTFADSVTERADEAYRWVKGLVTLRAGASRRVIDGEDYNQSHDSIHLAKGTVKIDGHQIHIGN